MTAYYNEFDPFAAQWLRNLIDAGHIAPGIVDDRSITDVTASDLAGFKQCHFFAGIGGWSLALRLAGIPDNFACWTGSPPCQPFSVAGKQLGQLDDRHLAPTFMRLIAECRPSVLFGEQVAAAIAKHWLDDLFTELEAEGYTCGAAVLPAASVGAPHKRERLYFGALAQSMCAEWDGEWLQGLAQSHQAQRSGEAAEPTGRGDIESAWSDVEGIKCHDNFTRPFKPGVLPLAHGISGRVGLLRGYGNAIVPQVAKEFVTAFMGAAADMANV